MFVINVRNVNYALEQGLYHLLYNSLRTASRNGPVLVAPTPVCTVYREPTRRVFFHPRRDANPFFHLMESMWILAGRNDIAFLKQYAKQMELYSDDGGITQPGAYGHRWRRHFGYDQLPIIISELKKDPLTRRCVLAMWDGGFDDAGFGERTVNGDLQKAAANSKDVPCNTHCYFSLHTGRLDMTVCCRSNDMVWGAYGANAVHFSVLQEFVALAVGAPVGELYQLSNNFHLYVERPDVVRLLGDRVANSVPTLTRDLYHENVEPSQRATPQPLFGFGAWEEFLGSVEAVLEEPRTTRSTFLNNVVVPMMLAHRAHKEGATADGVQLLEGSAIDWHIAGREWLQRRLDAKTGVAT